MGLELVNVGFELVNSGDTMKDFWTSFGIALIRDISENYDIKSISVFNSNRDFHIESAVDFH